MTRATSAVDPAGEACRSCRMSEQDCAWLYPCCADCRHWRGLDAQGNSRGPGGVQRHNPYLAEWMRRESAPTGRLPVPDNGDGPTANLMRLERQRALWAMAHGERATDNELIHNSSEDCGTVAS